MKKKMNRKISEREKEYVYITKAEHVSVIKKKERM